MKPPAGVRSPPRVQAFSTPTDLELWIVGVVSNYQLPERRNNRAEGKHADADHDNG
jgi:hypothetical protein